MTKAVDLLLGLFLAGAGSLAFAKPNIPIERIPPSTPYDVRVHIEALYSMDPVTRGTSAVQLARLGDRAEPAIPFLVAMLADSAKLEWEVAETDRPFDSVEEAKRRLRGFYKDKETSPGREAARALMRLCSSAIPSLLDALKDPEPHARKNAAEALGGIRDRKATEPLIALLKDEDKEVRGQAAKSLGRLQGPAAAEPLIAALKDPDRAVRREVAAALGEIRDPRALHPLLEALKDVIEVQEAAEQVLMDTRDPRAVEPLIVSLKDRSARVRRIAARLLGAINDRRAVKSLLGTLKDSTDDVRFEAAASLRRMSGEDHGTDPEKWQRWWELDSAARELAEKLAGDPVVAYIGALRHPEWAKRACAARELGHLKDSRAMGDLRGALWDKDATVRLNAARAMGEIGDPQAVDALLAAITDADESVQEAAELALRLVTNANFGRDTRKWQEWWDENRDIVFERYRQKLKEKGDAAAGAQAQEEEVRTTRPRTGALPIVLIILLVAAFPVGALLVIRIMRPK
jgi:HEAT repeat protein